MKYKGMFCFHCLKTLVFFMYVLLKSYLLLYTDSPPCFPVFLYFCCCCSSSRL